MERRLATTRSACLRQANKSLALSPVSRAHSLGRSEDRRRNLLRCLLSPRRLRPADRIRRRPLCDSEPHACRGSAGLLRIGLWRALCSGYSPWSRILDRDGTELAAGGYRSETLRFGFGSPVLTATINFDAVTLFADHNQEKMRDVERHYGRDVRIRFNQPNCLFTLESRSADLSVDEVMRNSASCRDATTLPNTTRRLVRSAC